MEDGIETDIEKTNQLGVEPKYWVVFSHVFKDLRIEIESPMLCSLNHIQLNLV